MIGVTEDGGYVQGTMDQLRDFEARQDELRARLATNAIDLPDLHPNVANIYRRKADRQVAALDNPAQRGGAAAAIKHPDRAYRARPRCRLGRRGREARRATSAPSSNGSASGTNDDRRTLLRRTGQSRWRQQACELPE